MDHKPSLSCCLNIYTQLSKSRLAHCVHAITACSSSSNISPALEFKGKNLCASRKCWTSLACSWSNWVSILTVRLRRRSPNWSSLRLFWKCEWHFTWKTNTHISSLITLLFPVISVIGRSADFLILTDTFTMKMLPPSWLVFNCVIFSSLLHPSFPPNHPSLLHPSVLSKGNPAWMTISTHPLPSHL